MRSTLLHLRYNLKVFSKAAECCTAGQSCSKPISGGGGKKAQMNLHSSALHNSLLSSPSSTPPPAAADSETAAGPSRRRPDRARARPSKLRLPFLSLVVKRGRGTAGRVAGRARSETARGRGAGKEGETAATRRKVGGRSAAR